MRPRSVFHRSNSPRGTRRIAIPGVLFGIAISALIAGLLSADPGGGTGQLRAIGDTAAIGAVADEIEPPVLHPGFALVLPESVPRGGILEVTVIGSRVSSFQAELVLPGDRVHTGHGWRGAAAFDPHREIWHTLLGIPSTAEPGEAHLRVSLQTRGGTDPVVLRGSVTIASRNFTAETIALNGAMTALRSEEDPRKVEESRVLWALLQSTDLTGRFHTGRFRMPLDSLRYTSFYGDRRTYAYSDGGSAGSIHNGVDLASPTGTPIHAPGRGRVRMAMDRIVTGGTIVIEHLPGVYSLYYHLDSVDVAVGQIVETGAVIGTVGSTGLSTGPHLHWELRVAGVAVDPAFVVEGTLLDTEHLRGTLSSVP